MAQYEVTFSAVNIPTNSGGASVTVEEDSDSDGTVDNSDTVTLSDGTTWYTTRDVFDGIGQVRLDFDLGPPTDVTLTDSVTGPVDVSMTTGSGSDSDQNPNTHWTIFGGQYDKSGHEYEGGGVTTKYEQ